MTKGGPQGDYSFKKTRFGGFSWLGLRSANLPICGKARTHRSRSLSPSFWAKRRTC